MELIVLGPLYGAQASLRQTSFSHWTGILLAEPQLPDLPGQDWADLSSYLAFISLDIFSVC